MKLTTFIMIIALGTVSAKGIAQKISLNVSNTPIEKVLQSIKQQSGFGFIYNAGELKNQKVSVRLTEVSVEDAVEAVIKNLSMEYTIREKNIVLTKKEKSYLETVIARFQAIDVRGKVVDSLGNGLPGATVSVKGTGKSTQTAQNGDFYIKNVEEGAVIVVSYLGYLTKEQLVSKEHNFIILSESSSKLDEVQIQAYGTITRRLNTGNISTVKAKDIGNQVLSDPILALKGTVPGMTIVQSSGMPGSAPKISIRGTNSFFNGTEPLVLIDGTPIDARLSPLYTIQGPGRNSLSAISFVNPNDVESIDVLKDADATAIYGSRGANGVILITTKRGKSGSAKIDIKMQHGIGEVARHRNLLNTQEYLEVRKEAFANDGIIPSDDPLESRLGYRYAPDLTIWSQTGGFGHSIHCVSK